MSDCLGPQRTGSPFVSLAVQADTRLRLEIEILDPKIRSFLYASPRVVKEQQERLVSQAVAPARWHTLEERIDLLTFQEVRLRRGDTFHRDSIDFLRGVKHLWNPVGDVRVERPKSRQTLVAGTDVVAASLLKMLEEGQSPLEAHILDAELCDRMADISGDISQE